MSLISGCEKLGGPWIFFVDMTARSLISKMELIYTRLGLAKLFSDSIERCTHFAHSYDDSFFEISEMRHFMKVLSA